MTPVAAEQEIVRLMNVSKIFQTDGHTTQAVRDISLTARKGELVLLLGPSGSGKTTLLTLIAGFLQPTSGAVVLLGRDIGEYEARELQYFRARHLGFIFQNFLLIDSLTVLENIMLVQEFLGVGRKPANEKADALLRRLGIQHLAPKFPKNLSQGEKQRIAIARALANSATLLLADEPTASLESGQGFAIIQILRDLAREEHRCVMVASHDARLVELADCTIRLEDGRAVSR